MPSEGKCCYSVGVTKLDGMAARGREKSDDGKGAKRRRPVAVWMVALGAGWDVSWFSSKCGEAEEWKRIVIYGSVRRREGT